MKRLLDASGGVIQTFHGSEDGNSFTIQTTVDAGPILRANRRAMAEAPDRWGPGRRVASIPINLWFQLERQGITRDDKRFRAWLNDPDNRAFRTFEGRV